MNTPSGCYCLVLSLSSNLFEAFPYTDEELDAAGLRGEGVAESVKQALNTMRKRPDLLNLSLFKLQCMNFAAQEAAASQLSPPDRPILSTIPSDATPYAPSDWERINYYNGVSPDPPELLYRSDLLKNPFPVPEDGHPYLIKSIHGVHNTPLNSVWHIVGPELCDITVRTGKTLLVPL